MMKQYYTFLRGHVNQHSVLALLLAGYLLGCFSPAENRAEADQVRGNSNPQPSPERAQEEAASGDLDSAGNLDKQGMEARLHGDLDRARIYHEQALRIKAKVAARSLGVADSLSGLGHVAYAGGDWQLARKQYGRAFVIREELAPDSGDMASSLYDLGNVASRTGDLELAEDYYKRALEIQERLTPQSADAARTLNNLGLLKLNFGEIDPAAGYFERALAIDAALVPDGIDVARDFNHLGVVAEIRGDLRLAEEYFERALRIEERLVSDGTDVVLTLSNLEHVARARGDVESAADYQRSLSDGRERLGPGSLDSALRFASLWLLASNRGVLESAAGYHQRLLDVHERLAPGGTSVAASLNNLGVVATVAGEPELAARYHQRALAVQQKLDPNSLETAHNFHNQGVLALKRGDLELAAEHHRRESKIKENLSPSNLDVTAGAYHNLGRAALRRGDVEKAEEYQRRVVAFCEKLTPSRCRESNNARFLGLLFLRTGDSKESMEHLHRAMDLSEAEISGIDPLQVARAELSAGYGGYRRDFTQILLEQGAFLDLLTAGERWGSANSPAPGNMEEQLNELQNMRRQLDETAISIPEPTLSVVNYNEPRELERDEIADILDPGTVMLAYVVENEKTDLVVVTRGDDIHLEALPVGEEELRQEVECFRSLITAEARPGTRIPDHCTTRSSRKAGMRLYAQLIEPVAGWVEKSERVLFMPSGPLQLLPWGALVRATGGNSEDAERDLQYLVEWKPLHSTIMPLWYTEVRHQDEHTARRLTLAVFGDPIYPQGAAFSLKPLPATRIEAEAIAKLYPGSAAVYLGEEATEEQAKALGRGVRYLHFATHTVFDERSPMYSGLALTLPREPAEGQDDGLLQAWEIYERKQLSAELVTLSACATGLGQDVGMEGLVGLTGAFQRAGARSVVASLWNVADEATAELMTRFYTYLNDGKSRDQALRLAQIDLIRGRANGARDDGSVRGLKHVSGPPVESYTSHPFYWAAFQLIGEWQ